MESEASTACTLAANSPRDVVVDCYDVCPGLAHCHEQQLAECNDLQYLRTRIKACQDSCNELYARNVRLSEELTAAHELIEQLMHTSHVQASP